MRLAAVIATFCAFPRARSRWEKALITGWRREAVSVAIDTTARISARPPDHWPGEPRYHARLEVHLDPGTQTTMQRFGRSAADVIRQLINQVTPEMFPQSWQQQNAGNDRRTRPTSGSDVHR